MYYNRKSIKIETAPVNLAVSLSDVKDFLRVDTSDDDSLLTSLIKAATSQMRNYLRRSLITETLKLTADRFGDYGSADDCLASISEGVYDVPKSYFYNAYDGIDLPFVPIQSVTSVTTYDRSNNSSVFSSSKYQLDEEGGRIYLNESETWPVDLRNREAVEIIYISGYGDNSSDLPDDIVTAIKMHVAQLYECGSGCGMSRGCKDMVDGYRLYDNMGLC